MDMARPKWVPKTVEQRRAIAALDRARQRAAAAAARAERLVDEADERMWKAARVANRLDVPATFIAERMEVTPRTVHRHLAEPDGSPDSGSDQPVTDG